MKTLTYFVDPTSVSGAVDKIICGVKSAKRTHSKLTVHVLYSGLLEEQVHSLRLLDQIFPHEEFVVIPKFQVDSIEQMKCIPTGDKQLKEFAKTWGLNSLIDPNKILDEETRMEWASQACSVRAACGIISNDSQIAEALGCDSTDIQILSRTVGKKLKQAGLSFSDLLDYKHSV